MQRALLSFISIPCFYSGIAASHGRHILRFIGGRTDYLAHSLGNPQRFAAVILQHFYELQLLLQLFDTKQHVDDAYSYYGTFFTNSSQYPCLQSRWIEIRDQKRTFRQMVRRIMDEGFWRRAVIHRVTNVEDDSLKEKKIV